MDSSLADGHSHARADTSTTPSAAAAVPPSVPPLYRSTVPNTSATGSEGQSPPPVAPFHTPTPTPTPTAAAAAAGRGATPPVYPAGTGTPASAATTALTPLRLYTSIAGSSPVPLAAAAAAAATAGGGGGGADDTPGTRSYSLPPAAATGPAGGRGTPPADHHHHYNSAHVREEQQQRYPLFGHRADDGSVDMRAMQAFSEGGGGRGGPTSTTTTTTSNTHAVTTAATTSGGSSRRCYVCEADVVLHGGGPAERRGAWDEHLDSALHRRLAQARATGGSNSPPAKRRTIVHQITSSSTAAVATDRNGNGWKSKSKSTSRRDHRRRRDNDDSGCSSGSSWSSAEERSDAATAAAAHSSSSRRTAEPADADAGRGPRHLSYHSHSSGLGDPLLNGGGSGGGGVRQPSPLQQQQQQPCGTRPEISVLSIDNEIPTRAGPGTAALSQGELALMVRQDEERRRLQRLERQSAAMEARRQASAMRGCFHRWYGAMFARATSPAKAAAHGTDGGGGRGGGHRGRSRRILRIGRRRRRGDSSGVDSHCSDGYHCKALVNRRRRQHQRAVAVAGGRSRRHHHRDGNEHREDPAPPPPPQQRQRQRRPNSSGRSADHSRRPPSASPHHNSQSGRGGGIVITTRDKTYAKVHLASDGKVAPAGGSSRSSSSGRELEVEDVLVRWRVGSDGRRQKESHGPRVRAADRPRGKRDTAAGAGGGSARHLARHAHSNTDSDSDSYDSVTPRHRHHRQTPFKRETAPQSRARDGDDEGGIGRTNSGNGGAHSPSSRYHNSNSNTRPGGTRLHHDPYDGAVAAAVAARPSQPGSPLPADDTAAAAAKKKRRQRSRPTHSRLLEFGLVELGSGVTQLSEGSPLRPRAVDGRSPIGGGDGDDAHSPFNEGQECSLAPGHGGGGPSSPAGYATPRPADGQDVAAAVVRPTGRAARRTHFSSDDSRDGSIQFSEEEEEEREEEGGRRHRGAGGDDKGRRFPAPRSSGHYDDEKSKARGGGGAHGRGRSYLNKDTDTGTHTVGDSSISYYESHSDSRHERRGDRHRDGSDFSSFSSRLQPPPTEDRGGDWEGGSGPRSAIRPSSSSHHQHRGNDNAGGRAGEGRDRRRRGGSGRRTKKLSTSTASGGGVSCGSGRGSPRRRSRTHASSRGWSSDSDIREMVARLSPPVRGRVRDILRSTPTLSASSRAHGNHTTTNSSSSSSDCGYSSEGSREARAGKGRRKGRRPGARRHGGRDQPRRTPAADALYARLAPPMRPNGGRRQDDEESLARFPRTSIGLERLHPPRRPASAASPSSPGQPPFLAGSPSDAAADAAAAFPSFQASIAGMPPGAESGYDHYYYGGDGDDGGSGAYQGLTTGGYSPYAYPDSAAAAVGSQGHGGGIYALPRAFGGPGDESPAATLSGGAFVQSPAAVVPASSGGADLGQQQHQQQWHESFPCPRRSGSVPVVAVHPDGTARAVYLHPTPTSDYRPISGDGRGGGVPAGLNSSVPLPTHSGGGGPDASTMSAQGSHHPTAAAGQGNDADSWAQDHRPQQQQPFRPAAAVYAGAVDSPVSDGHSHGHDSHSRRGAAYHAHRQQLAPTGIATTALGRDDDGAIRRHQVGDPMGYLRSRLPPPPRVSGASGPVALSRSGAAAAADGRGEWRRPSQVNAAASEAAAGGRRAVGANGHGGDNDEDNFFDRDETYAALVPQFTSPPPSLPFSQEQQRQLEAVPGSRKDSNGNSKDGDTPPRSGDHGPDDNEDSDDGNAGRRHRKKNNEKSRPHRKHSNHHRRHRSQSAGSSDSDADGLSRDSCPGRHQGERFFDDPLAAHRGKGNQRRSPRRIAGTDHRLDGGGGGGAGDRLATATTLESDRHPYSVNGDADAEGGSEHNRSSSHRSHSERCPAGEGTHALAAAALDGSLVDPVTGRRRSFPTTTEKGNHEMGSRGSGSGSGRRGGQSPTPGGSAPAPLGNSSLATSVSHRGGDDDDDGDGDGDGDAAAAAAAGPFPPLPPAGAAVSPRQGMTPHGHTGNNASNRISRGDGSLATPRSSLTSSRLPLAGELGAVYVREDSGRYRRVPDLTAASLHNHNGEPIYIVAAGREHHGSPHTPSSFAGDRGGGDADRIPSSSVSAPHRDDYRHHHHQQQQQQQPGPGDSLRTSGGGGGGVDARGCGYSSRHPSPYRHPTPRRHPTPPHPPLTRAHTPLGCGRLNPYCATCRARFNLIYVDASMAPVRWPSPQAAGLEQLGECRYREGFLFGGPSADPLLLSSGGGGRTASARRTQSRTSPASTPFTQRQRQQQYGHRSVETYRSPTATATATATPSSAQPLERLPSGGAFVPVRFRRASAVPSPTRHYYDNPTPNRGHSGPPRRREEEGCMAKRGTATGSRRAAAPHTATTTTATATTSTEDTHISAGIEKKRRPAHGDPAADQQRREERRLRRRMKQLLWRDLPEQRDSGEWAAYLASLGEGLDLLRGIVAQEL